MTWRLVMARLAVAVVLGVLSPVSGDAKTPGSWVFNTFENHCMGPAPDSDLRLQKLQPVADRAPVPLLTIRAAEYQDPRLFGFRIFDFIASDAETPHDLNCGVYSAETDAEEIFREFSRRSRYKQWIGTTQLDKIPLAQGSGVFFFLSSLQDEKAIAVMIQKGTEVLLLSRFRQD